MRWDWRPPAAFLAAAVACLAGGLTAVSSGLVGLLVAAVVLLLTRLDAAPDPAWDRRHYVGRHGARGEVQDLAWTMVGRDGRIGERVLRQLRDVARSRLARHGRSLDDADIEQVIGSRAHRTLTRTRSPLPTVADVRHTLDVLDRLGPRRTPTDDDDAGSPLS
ncbi:hypothetical protein [Cellulomonas xylanilytica]|uniref:Uncharacterized protein n=1 Tax=Cellulomonas xylanilytica TaxID=233583 RepID=A0A510V533_9CELL|nr:hypothetical protein [Cellulomonas xylanilytica]GEK21973.1 hypothetical protein CXY01_24930 [Cellulomonas xylanilytica]